MKIKKMVYWFLGLLESLFLGCKVSKCQSLLLSWFLGFWFLGFKVSCFLGLLVH